MPGARRAGCYSGQVYRGRASGFQGAEPTGLPPHSTHWRHGLAEPSLEKEEVRPDGRIEVQRKGSLTLLDEWLRAEIVWDDANEFRKIVIAPLREVRRLRQEPAHTFTTDRISTNYYDSRRKLLWAVFNSLSNIRATFAKHPSARDIKVPSWLDDEVIDVS
jgi:hypothetical protein